MTKFMKLHPNAKDLSGRSFGRLKALGPIRKERDISGRSLLVWQCRCSCGTVIETRSCNLLNGDTSSCGCYQREDIASRSTKHGQAKRSGPTPERITWKNMRARCENPKASNYAWYGGRGIKVCDRWQSFVAFYEDMGPRPSADHSIERDDTNGDYEPRNCRWATRAEQGANKRNNRLLTAFGETHHMQEWCRIKGISQRTLWDRLNAGWEVEKALSTSTAHE
jgi:hypothetical protein